MVIALKQAILEVSRVKNVYFLSIKLFWYKGMDIKDLVDIVILRYDNWPQFFLKMTLV